MLYVDIKKRLGSFALDVKFETGDGVTALLGPSGCGKSMTLKCIAGIEKPDSGRIVLGDRVLFDSEKGVNLPTRERRTGYIFQSYALFPNMTVRENVMYGISGGKRERTEKADGILKRMYIEDIASKYPAQLSGGQQQRVALARTIASDPEVLMLDEPFSALDSYLKWRLEQQLSDVLADYGGSSLLVSHDRDEVYRLSRYVVVINNGRSEPMAPVDTLFRHPHTLTAALLSGCKNYSFIDRTGGDRVYARDWGAELRAPREVPENVSLIGVRAHYLQPVHGPGENTMLCRVLRVVRELFSMTVTMRPVSAPAETDYSDIRLELPIEQWQEFDCSDTIWIHVPPGSMLLLREHGQNGDAKEI